ncbi:activin receptor type-2A-like [Artemia franciscana]|uniref:Serine/threonine-protein kinase receptor n=1 Tax=Artemia franciscana TaxID=6661 RepID=A0AA88H8Q8_ARTSF|nr:hypothetical protein QYM36_016721 [Artemia franciscana]KAK2704420.1 hypothetical protein QYM36_016721 [Artemia franciscana]
MIVKINLLIQFGFLCFFVILDISYGIVTECEYYGPGNCSPEAEKCSHKEFCTGENNGASCYVAWKVNPVNGQVEVSLKGCAYGHRDCGNSSCLGDLRSSKNSTIKTYYCCCLENNCNSEFSINPNQTFVSRPSNLESVIPVRHNPSIAVINALIYTLAILVVLTFSVAIGYWMYRKKKLSRFNELPTSDTTCYESPSLTQNTIPVHLMEVKARGRFGAVWKAVRKAEVVAVKIFPPQDKQSWLAEREVYKLPQMEHENILTFLGAEKRGDNIQAEYLLITEFHELGSLCDYLKSHTVTWQEACRIAESMTRGLAHLHEEIHAKDGSVKPAVAHRDFKSKNVLLKSDLTACIADFGLAFIFTPGQSIGDTHGQVGTRRYMAPEVLEGAINFNRDSFLRIDMYAVSLVLWEILTRCSTTECEATDYMLPFEAEVGQHPTLEDIQECVVHQKKRPVIKDVWKRHPGMATLCITVEECWDGDSEARLSASCVLERLSVLNKLYQVSPTSYQSAISTQLTPCQVTQFTSVLLDNEK